MRLATLLLAAAFALPHAAIPPAAADEHDHADDAHHVATLPGVRIVHAWTRATDGRSALVFADIENTGTGEVVLRAAGTDAAGEATLVGLEISGGDLDLVPLPMLPIAPGRTLELAPNGVAIQLQDLTRPLEEGDEIEVEFGFDIGVVDVHVAVEPAGALEHSHAGHQH